VNGDQSRRAFLKRSAILTAAAGSAAPLLNNLACIGDAAASTASDYKALVCIFLYGGNDYANTLTPYDQANYTAYQAQRSNIAYARDALTATALSPNTALPGGAQYALAPALLPLLPVFNAGQLAPILNVGTLIQPTTKAQFQAKSVPLPPKLMSHNDQQSFFQSSATEGATSGWGGRMGDLLQSQNGTATLTCINTNGNAVFLSGTNAVQYTIGVNGAIAAGSVGGAPFGSTTVGSVMSSLVTAPRTHIFENEYTRVTKRSLDAYSQVTTALGAGPAIRTTFPSSNFLADQLKVIARLISVGQQLGAKRQVFFASIGGFDTHDNLATAHPALLAKVAAAMKSFYDATVELGVAGQVTSFTGSDFGRTLLSNNGGTDHGWGSHHFVMGGAVKGKQIYGSSPEYANGGANDFGQGRLIPTTSVDQYAATLAKWFGITDSQMSTVLPNIGNYNASTRDVGFL
jgi:uncharacterized protein (DUF1501 family)